MTKSDKLIQKFLSKPKDLTWDELTKFLSLFGYQETTSGKTSGSARTFIHQETKHSFSLHKPHPKNIVKSYVINIVIKTLQENDLL